MLFQCKVGIIAASLMGIIFPGCECSIVPIMRGLIKKGVSSRLCLWTS